MSKLIDVTVQVHMEPDRAILVSDDGDKAKAKWLPKSQIEMEPKNVSAGIYEITLPEWPALDKGLI